MALSLTKCLLMAWQWNIKVHGEDYCPPALTVLNICQFITNEEMAGGMGEPHWFMAYSHALQQVAKVACGRKWEWPWREALEVRASPLMHASMVASLKLCWELAPTPYTGRGKAAPQPTSSLTWTRWLSMSPAWTHGTSKCG